jgi:glycosyltransferase involved in cell wall biosynthesis
MLWLFRHRHHYHLIVFHSYCGWVYNLFRKLSPGKVLVITAFHGLEALFFQRLAAQAQREHRPLSYRFRLFIHFQNMVIRSSCQRSQAITCLNGEEEAYLIAHNYQKSNAITRLAHWVEEKFIISRVYNPSAKELLFVGQWLPTKGIDYLITSFAEIIKEQTDLRLNLVGTRVNRAEVLASIPASLHKHIHVYPQVDPAQMPDFYAQADIFIFPSLSEGFSCALLEAMAAGLPIIATSIGAAPDLLQDHHNALLIPAADTSALIRALKELLCDPMLRRKIGEQVQTSAQNYLPTTVFAQHRRFWTELWENFSSFNQMDSPRTDIAASKKAE